MNLLRTVVLPVFAAGAWISVSEFVRNQFLLNGFWTAHYQKLGLVFPSAPVNGAVWGIWSMAFAAAVFVIAKRFSLIETAVLSWFIGFVLMWLVIGNLNVLPFAMLFAAVPLSMLEAFVAAFIIKKTA